MTVAEDDIPVIIELDDDHIRLSASGTEIGQWRTQDCRISHVSETTYSISAEDETLSFVPNQPSLFAAAINGKGSQQKPAAVAPPESDVEIPREEPDSPLGSDGIREAPEPKPATMGLFYALCVLTVALAVWALISMVL